MIPVEVDRDEAREAARRELADPVYQAAEPSLVDRILAWIGRVLTELFSGVLALSAGPAGLIVLAVVIAIVVVIVRLRVGRIGRAARAGRPALFEGRPLSAADHRRAAQEAAARGDFTGAVRERFRALARELEQRGVLDELAGRTVDEIAEAAGLALPDSATELRDAARIFDDAVYGGRPATMDGYEFLSTLDNRLRGERVGAIR